MMTISKNSKGKTAASALAVALAVLAAGTLKADLPVAVSSNVGTGFWMAKFSAATNLAKKASAPMVLFWTNEGCTQCGLLEDAVNTDEFKAWQAEHQDYIYCYVQGQESKDVSPNAGSGAVTFARTAAGKFNSSKALTSYPFVCLYWPQTNGTVKATAFTGRTGKMLVTTSGLTLAEQLEKSIEKYFSGYAKASVDFRCGDTSGLADFDFVINGKYRTNRLEAEPSTTLVPVPLKRTGAIAGTTTSSLVIEWPDGIKPVETNTFTWASLETNKFINVDMTLPDGFDFPEGKRIELALFDETENLVATNGITFVAAMPNSASNPYWIGEKTADTLGFAEWTQDYDIVREKVAAGNADYTLAFITGPLWCPWCHGLEECVFNDARFGEWCESNRVQVAFFDIRQYEKNGGGSALLNYNQSDEHLSRYCYSQLTNGYNTSGASYLGRHGLTDMDEDVVAVRDRAWKYASETWQIPEHEPDSARLFLATVLLINKDNNVVGRFDRWHQNDYDDGSELCETLGRFYHEPNENFRRLDDLLKLADRGSEAQDYASLTTNTCELGGSVVSTLQVNDTQDHYLLSLPSRGKAVFSVVEKTADRNVRLAIVRDGTETAYSTNGTLEVEFTRADCAAKRLVLRVSAPNISDETLFSGESTVFNATVTNAFEAITQDEGYVYSDFATKTPLSSYVVTSGQKVTITVTKGTLPKGLSLVWDSATSSVVVKGTTTQTGTFNFTYRVVVKSSNGKKTISSESTKTALTVASPATVNPYYAKAITASVPLYKTDEWGVTTLSSAIQISQTTKKALTAKRFNGGTTTFSGKWTKFNSETGLLTSSIKSGSTTLKTTLDMEGRLTAVIGSTTGTVSVATGYADFAGSYTVSMPVDETTAWYYTFGAGYLTLKSGTMNSGKGLVTYAGVLPNGIAVSGSAYLGGDPDDNKYAILPIYTRSTRNLTNGSKKYATKDDLAAVLRIRANGANLYGDEETVRVVLAPDGVNSLWKRTTSATGNALTCTMNVYGGYYVPGATLQDWLDLFELGSVDALEAHVDGEEVPVVNFAFNKTTGVVTGKAKTTVDRRTVVATFKGVITPGWLDCGCGDADRITRPFATGTFSYSSNVSGFTTPSSLEFNLVAP